MTAGARDRPRRLALAAAPLLLFVLAGVLAPIVAPGGPEATDLGQSLRGPSWAHPLGTDQLGRDQAVRLLYAARTSLAIVAAVLAIAVCVGVLVGTLVGAAGGLVERIGLRVFDVALSMPTLVVALAVLGIRGRGTGNLVVALAVFAWAPYARIARGVVAAHRESAAIEALRVLGARPARILGRHLLPEAVRPALVYASTDIGAVVLATATLSFLGLGVSPPTPEWGRMLVESRPFLPSALWLALAPGVAVTAVVISGNVLGERLATRPAPAAPDPPPRADARASARQHEPAEPRGQVGASATPGTYVVTGLQVAFPGGRGQAPTPVVHGVSYALRSGRTLALVGASGSGKTASVLGPLGLLPGAVVSGSARLAGTELIGAGERDVRAVRGRRIGVVFQDPFAALNPLRTVGSQVDDAVRNAAPGTSRAVARRRTVELLGTVGLPDPARLARVHPHELSGGMRQRVLIAAALAGDPEVVVADEPTSALDVTVQAQIVGLLQRLAADAGTAMLLVSHDLALVAEVADDIAVIDRGRIVEQGPTGAVLASPDHDVTRALLDAAPRLDGHAAHRVRAAALADVTGTS